MRCPDCAKFVSLEFSDPVVDQIEISADGEVNCTVTLTRTCTDCGNDLKTASLEMEVDYTEQCKDHVDAAGDAHDLNIAEGDVNQIEESGGRYAKSYFGAEVCFKITCKCDPKFEIEGSVLDKVAASEMEECC